jgi:hypothetical protein
MAGRGPTPKAQRIRARATRQPAQFGRSRVVSPRLPGARAYSAATRRWYAVWTSAEQAEKFTPTDWQRLHMLAPLVDAYFASPSKELMAEIRLNESKLGATAEDRQRLRWDLGPPPATRPVAAQSRRRADPRLAVVEDG